MAHLIRYNETALKTDLARAYGSMELATRVATTGMSEIARTHAYGAQQVTHTLATAHSLVQAAGAISSAQQRQVQYRTQRYLSDMLQITDTTAATIVSRMR